jgi:hypothetical protein
MATTYQLTAYDLVNEALTIQLSMTYPNPNDRTTFTVTWTEPRSMNAYDGGIVLVSKTPATISRRPNDGNRYSASPDLSTPTTPSIMIDGAQIVAAIYGDKLTRSVVVTGADPMAVYYVTFHAVSNVLQYHGDGIRAYPQDSTQIKTDTAQIAGEIPFDDLPPTNLTTADRGQVYYNTIAGQVYMWTGVAWIPANSGSINSGIITKNPDGTLGIDVTPPLSAPAIAGDFFYDTFLKRIFVWDGAKWDWANKQNENVPMVDKLGVGTDGSQDERSRLITILKTQLGYPTQCVELSEDAFNIAIDNALDEVRQLTDNAYTQVYLPMRIVPNQQTYVLNDPRNDSNKIVSINKIYRLSGYGGLVTTGDNGVYSQIFLQQMFNPAQIDLVSIHLAAQVQEEFQRLFAGDVTFNWHENRRELTLLRRLSSNERVLLECVMERTEQELLQDRYLKQWIQGWAMSECMETLGYIRSKFASLPGAGGGISLNGSEMISQADAMQTELRRQVNDYEIGNYAGVHGNSAFLIG